MALRMGRRPLPCMGGKPPSALPPPSAQVQGDDPALHPLRWLARPPSLAIPFAHARGVSFGGACAPIWSGSRTRDRRINSPMLYPLSYPVARRAGFEPAANDIVCRCSTSELTSTSRNTLAQVSAYALGKTPRTGWALEPIPLKPADLMLRIAGCFQSAIRLGIHMPECFPVLPFARTEAPRCSAHAPVAAAPFATARTHRVLRAEEIFREPDS